MTEEGAGYGLWWQGGAGPLAVWKEFLKKGLKELLIGHCQPTLSVLSKRISFSN